MNGHLDPVALLFIEDTKPMDTHIKDVQGYPLCGTDDVVQFNPVSKATCKECILRYALKGVLA